MLLLLQIRLTAIVRNNEINMINTLYYIINSLKPLIATIFIVCMSINMVGFMDPLPSSVRMGVAIVIILYNMVKGVRYDKSYLLFMLYLVINVFLASPDPIFKSGERLLYFLAIFLVVSPLVKGESASMIRMQSLKVFLFIGILLTMLSAIGFFFGINMMRFEDENIDPEERIYMAGSFSGFFNHSMTLAPFASISSCCILYYILKTKNLKLLILLVPCILTVMFAASRTAFIAMIISMIVLLYKFLNSNDKFLKYILGISLLIFALSPTLTIGMEGLNSKGQIITENGFSTRTIKWQHRIDEFRSSPLIGVGFAAAWRSHISLRNKDGVIEPGSSWLAIASMTGIIGLIWVIYFFLTTYIRALNSNNSDSVLLVSLLTFISIHMISEGYIYAGGSTLCVFVWLILGCINDMQENNL